ncbi:protein kinase (incomplete catalytic triad) [Cyclospora cayetanensis]|uniref:Protein kinase (Incomplete catalytic triad) n=1 Tax=Cyclospora cayetanensis TaxID=88456 RepID=A0A1D3D3Z1_9EIME|nr:protein kinase (incomplete catalytic triad) [Cyclospora cayetanensis]
MSDVFLERSQEYYKTNNTAAYAESGAAAVAGEAFARQFAAATARKRSTNDSLQPQNSELQTQHQLHIQQAAQEADEHRQLQQPPAHLWHQDWTAAAFAAFERPSSAAPFEPNQQLAGTATEAQGALLPLEVIIKPEGILEEEQKLLELLQFDLLRHPSAFSILTKLWSIAEESATAIAKRILQPQQHAEFRMPKSSVSLLERLLEGESPDDGGQHCSERLCVCLCVELDEKIGRKADAEGAVRGSRTLLEGCLGSTQRRLMSRSETLAHLIVENDVLPLAAQRCAALPLGDCHDSHGRLRWQPQKGAPKKRSQGKESPKKENEN